MLLRQLFDKESSTYTYLVADPATKEAALIDPVAEQVDRDLQLVQELGLNLKYALDTHVHADHVTGSGLLRERTGARTVASNKGAECVDLRLAHGDRLPLGRYEIEVLETPGHTDDSVSYLVDDQVFTGDALFVRGTGRTDFQNGDPEALYRSLTEVLFALPEQTVVWPGHDYRGHTVTTIGEEKRHNPRVSGKSRAQFVEIMNDLGLPRPRKIDQAVPANRECGQVQEATG
ncbi:MAG: MBL fold metallo-hydrolase [Myxococcota bacterium]